MQPSLRRCCLLAQVCCPRLQERLRACSLSLCQTETSPLLVRGQQRAGPTATGSKSRRCVRLPRQRGVDRDASFRPSGLSAARVASVWHLRGLEAAWSSMAISTTASLPGPPNGPASITTGPLGALRQRSRPHVPVAQSAVPCGSAVLPAPRCERQHHGSSSNQRNVCTRQRRRSCPLGSHGTHLLRRGDLCPNRLEGDRERRSLYQRPQQHVQRSDEQRNHLAGMGTGGRKEPRGHAVCTDCGIAALAARTRRAPAPRAFDVSNSGREQSEHHRRCAARVLPGQQPLALRRRLPSLLAAPTEKKITMVVNCRLSNHLRPNPVTTQGKGLSASLHGVGRRPSPCYLHRCALEVLRSCRWSITTHLDRFFRPRRLHDGPRVNDL